MALHRIVAVVLRQAYLLQGSFTRVLPLFAWVGVDMVLWGFITRYLNAISASGVNFVAVFLGAVLLWDFFTRVMQGVTMAFFEDVWSRNFLNFFATPLSMPEYMGGLVLTSIATSAIGLVVMIVLAHTIFHLSFFAYGFPLIAFLCVLQLFGIALGICACAMVLRFGPAFEWFVWPIPAIVAPFAGVFYPVATLPGWMQAVARAIPPSYVFDGMRSIVAGDGVAGSALLSGGGLAVCYVLMAGAFFVRTYRHAVRTGLIVRYSAETAS